MIVRRAEKKDIPRMIELLSQVLEVHADLRGDIFIKGTTKYSPQELEVMLEEKDRAFFAAADEDGMMQGYAMCKIEKPPHSSNMHDILTVYIDDLCVDQECRRKHAGKLLFEEVCRFAKEIGAYHITLNVWTGNQPAERFYESLGMKPLSTTMEMILK